MKKLIADKLIMKGLLNKTMRGIRDNWLLISILIIATIIRLYNIGFQSPWMDEIYTLKEADPSNSLSEVYKLVVNGEANPPLYFYSVHFLFKIFPYSIETARIFSVALGILGVYAIYLLGRAFFNRNAGLTAAFLLSINHFHIFYSQEARPYTFFCTFSIFSLYWMVRFIKEPTWRNTVYFSFFSTLMIYGHFFGLLGLFAQYLIILYVIIAGPAEDRKKIFIKSFVSGIMTLILYLPSLKILSKMAKVDNFWIPQPDLTVYTDVYKSFFGNSELLLAIGNLLLLLYFIGLSLHRRNLKTEEFPWSNIKIFSFVIFSVWIIVMLSIPLVRSYLSAPMIIDRYYINVLPVVLLLVAAGLTFFKSRTVIYTILTAYLAFSIVDITVVKNYYYKPTKTQFREAADYIKANNEDNHPVVTTRGWYLDYFLKDKNYNIVDRPIEKYIDNFKQDTTKIEAFWYIEGHSIPYNVSAEDQEFLNKHFLLDGSYDGVDIFTKFFIPIKDVGKFIDLNKFGNLKAENGNKILYNIEIFEAANDSLIAGGWSFFDGLDAQTSITKLLLIKEEEEVTYLGGTRMQRPDVSEYFNNGYNLSNTGFNLTTQIKDLKKGTYNIAIYMRDRMNGKEGLVISDKVIKK
jgi:mannosyltransferase